MSKGKWWAIAAGALVVVAVAVGAGVALTRKKSGDSSSSSSSSGTSSANLQSDPKDPSIFEKDDRFHKSFYAMAYTPFNALEPWCGATLANVTEDIQILSQLTTRLRLYGSACGAADFTLQAIKDTKVNMTVWLGAYVGDNTTVNAEQQQWIVDALKKHGTDNVEGVTIGNEYLLNSADETTAVNYLVQQMNSFRTTVNGLGLTKTIPVGTADAGSKISLNLVSSADFFLANVHPFFGGLPVEQAGNWTWDYFTQTDQPVCAQASNKPTCIIAETGWPTNSMTAANMTYQAATAGIPELQTFLDTFVCLANQNGTQYFYFEPFDEPWKEMYGGVEPYWGLLDHNRKFKNGITLPNCPIV
ncbi:glycoside hydrolase [Meredithblackwellia eburnea MCA 4105]